MNKLMNNVKENICELRHSNYSCSQATFLGICKAFNCVFTEEQLMALSAGFRGGIGRSYNEGTCGALSAGTMALGVFLPAQDEKAVALSKELFEYFKRKQGTVICGNIVQKHGFTKCTGCCLCVGKKVTELLLREND